MSFEFLYAKWILEAEQITRDLGLVYSENNPPPPGRNLGDVLPASNNAITHAYVSSKITQYFGYDIAKFFGDYRELTQPQAQGMIWIHSKIYGITKLGGG
jgi:hypothetical protein